MTFKTLSTVSAVALSAWVVQGASQAGAETITYGNFMPEAHPINQEAIIPYFDRVEAQTDGGVTLDLQAGSVITGTKTTLEGIGSYLVTAGYVADLYVPSSLPTSVMITNLGMIPTTPLAGSAAVTELTLLNCPDCLAEFDDYGATTLGVQRITDYVMYCREGIETAADMRGANIKVSSNWGLIVEKLGANPVNVQASEMYEAFQRGLIDCAIAPEVWLEVRSLWDTAKVLIDLPLGSFQGGHYMAMNRDVWEGLPDEERAAMVDQLPSLLTEITDAYIHGDESARENGAAHGMKIVEPDPEFVRILEEASAESEALAISRGHEEGVEDPEGKAALFRELAAKWEAIEAEANGDRAAFQARVKEEIYDKFDG